VPYLFTYIAEGADRTVKEAAANRKKKRKLFLLAATGYRRSDHMAGVASSLAFSGN
jgi:hypothetical protein